MPVAQAETRRGRDQARQPGRKKNFIRHAADWPLDRFAVVGRAWEGQTAAIFAGGPSLAVADIERCRDAGIRTIAVNDAYRLAPWADVLYFADARWWVWHRDKPEFKAFPGLKVTIENTGAAVAVEDPEIFLLHNAGGDGLSDKPNGLKTGFNSGHQAINLAVLAGARRILLLGYDMQQRDGKTHWFGEHPSPTAPSVFSVMLQAFPATVEPLRRLGVEVINCTPGSALKCFPMRSLDVALA